MRLRRRARLGHSRVREPGESLAFSDPTFAMIPVFAQINGLVPVSVPMTPSWDVDPEALVATGARIIYLCSPNNPTGTLRLARGARAAHCNRSGHGHPRRGVRRVRRRTRLELAAASDRVLVVRTMSKAFGLAGLRIGYAVGAPALVAEVEKVARAVQGERGRRTRSPGGAGEGSRVGRSTSRRGAGQSRSARRSRCASWGSRRFRPRPTSSWCPCGMLADVSRRMRERGVAVRVFEGLPSIGDALRITVGPWHR